MDDEESALKKPRLGNLMSGEHEGWMCECGNVNFADRLFCNLRKCNKAKPGADIPSTERGGPKWVCEHCDNENFSDRTTCNMRKCGQPRPGFEQQAGFGKGGKVAQMFAPSFAPSFQYQASFSAPVKGGATWVCGHCGNENYSDRTTCNLRKCGMPRMNGCQQFGKGKFNPMNAMMGQIYQHQFQPQQAMMPYGGYGGKGMPAIGMGKGKAAAVGRAPAPPAAVKEGWTCTCGNVNFADREKCNMNSCGLPRPATGLHTGWICSQCGNKNFADRMVCNMRKCGAERPS